ncbi:MAG: hypothetical protein LBG09_02085 [Puniceicoccales bacterium]|jgi:hypothetical protein|nr:hypothetical protein [Puniceicoccales bacterium]
MERGILVKKAKLISILLAVPFSVGLQINEGIASNTARQISPPRRRARERTEASGPRQPAEVTDQTRICKVTHRELTPKEKQISALLRHRFYQFVTNNPSHRGPLFGLYATAAANNLLSDGEGEAGQPVLEHAEIMQIAAQFSPEAPNPLSVPITPELVHQIAIHLNRPILFIDVGNKFFTYGPGPIDIIKYVILAQPQELDEDLSNSEEEEEEDRPPVILQRKTWLRDHKALEIIRRCGPNANIICYNSHFKRALFFTPIPIATARNTDLGTQRRCETAILKISRQRAIRNVVDFTIATGTILASAKLFALITAGSVTHFLVSVKDKIANFGEQLFANSGNGSSTSNPPQGNSNPPPAGNTNGDAAVSTGGETSNSNPPPENPNPPPQGNTGGNAAGSTGGETSNSNPPQGGTGGGGSGNGSAGNGSFTSNPPLENPNPPPQGNTNGDATGSAGNGTSNSNPPQGNSNPPPAGNTNGDAAGMENN